METSQGWDVLGSLALQGNHDIWFQKLPRTHGLIIAYIYMTSYQDGVKLDTNEHGIRYLVIIRDAFLVSSEPTVPTSLLQPQLCHPKTMIPSPSSQFCGPGKMLAWSSFQWSVWKPSTVYKYIESRDSRRAILWDIWLHSSGIKRSENFFDWDWITLIKCNYEIS